MPVIAYLMRHSPTAQQPESSRHGEPVVTQPIDCDVHLAVPNTRTLVPYLDDYWREHVIRRGIDGDNLELSAYPPNAPLNCRPDWRPAKGLPGSQFEQLRDHVLEHFPAALRHLQRAARRADHVQRGSVGRAVPRDQRLDRRRVARSRSAAARVHRRAGAQPGTGRAGDRASRRRHALRAGADARA